MLSQVETGKTTPTIAVLWKIVTGFGVPFSELLREDESARTVVVRRGARPALTSADRKFHSIPIILAGTPLGVELYRITLEPQGGSSSPAHAAGTWEMACVEQGKLRLVVGQEEHVLEPGDTATFPADLEHSYSAVGPSKCVFYDLVRYGSHVGATH